MVRRKSSKISGKFCLAYALAAFISWEIGAKAGRQVSNRFFPKPAGLEKQVVQPALEIEKKRFVVEPAVYKTKSFDDNKPNQIDYKTKKIVVLDPGHGMGNRKKGLYDPGAVVGNLYEAEIVLNQAKKIKRLLEKKGYEVYLTRENSEKSTPLDSRAKLAEKLKADVFISLHCNAAEAESAYGQEVFYNEGRRSEMLAQSIQSKLIKGINPEFKTRNRKTKKAMFRVLKAKIPSVLVESGFLTNKNDRTYLTDNIDDVEQAIAEAIHSYISH